MGARNSVDGAPSSEGGLEPRRWGGEVGGSRSDGGWGVGPPGGEAAADAVDEVVESAADVGAFGGGVDFEGGEVGFAADGDLGVVDEFVELGEADADGLEGAPEVEVAGEGVDVEAAGEVGVVRRASSRVRVTKAWDLSPILGRERRSSGVRSSRKGRAARMASSWDWMVARASGARVASMRFGVMVFWVLGWFVVIWWVGEWRWAVAGR